MSAVKLYQKWLNKRDLNIDNINRHTNVEREVSHGVTSRTRNYRQMMTAERGQISFLQNQSPN